MKTNVYNIVNASGKALARVTCSTIEQAAAKCKHLFPLYYSLLKIEHVGEREI